MPQARPPPAATAHPAHSTHSLAPALRGPGPGSGSGRLSSATPLLRTPARAAPGQSSEGEKTGLGQARGRAAPSYKGKDRKEAWDTAAPQPFPHSGRTPAPPRSVPTSNRGAPLPTCSTAVRGTAACLFPRPRGGRRRTPRVLAAAEPRAGRGTGCPRQWLPAARVTNGRSRKQTLQSRRQEPGPQSGNNAAGGARRTGKAAGSGRMEGAMPQRRLGSW